MKLRDFTHLRPVKRQGKVLLYGATTADGPWFRLSKRETKALLPSLIQYVAQQQQLSQNATLDEAV